MKLFRRADKPRVDLPYDAATHAHIRALNAQGFAVVTQELMREFVSQTSHARAEAAVARAELTELRSELETLSPLTQSCGALAGRIPDLVAELVSTRDRLRVSEADASALAGIAVDEMLAAGNSESGDE